MRREREGGGALAVILVIVVGVPLLMLAGLIWTGLYIAHNVRVTTSPQEQSVQVETPFGSLQVKEDSLIDAKRMGVPIYPGATIEFGKRKLASLDLELGNMSKNLRIVAVEYTTPDSAERVRDFYRKKLPHWIFTEKDNGGWQMDYSEDGYKRIIAIEEQRGSTRIGVASIGEPASN